MTQRQNPIKGIRNQQAWLLRCLANLDPDNGDIVPHLIEALIEIDQQMELAVTSQNKTVTAHRNNTETANTTMTDLSQILSDARHHMRRRVKRENFPPGLIEKLGLKRHQPASPTSREWLLLARDMIEGDNLAVEAGYEPMAQPSAEDLQTHLESAETALKEADDTEATLEKAQTTLRKISEELAELILDTAACLRFTQRRKPAPQRRRVMRRYGFTFKGDPPEPTKNEPTQPDPSTTQQPQSQTEKDDPPTQPQTPQPNQSPTIQTQTTKPTPNNSAPNTLEPKDNPKSNPLPGENHTSHRRP